MIDSRTVPYAALLLRLALGIMFIAHGCLKLFVFTPAGTVGYFQSVGFAGWLAYPVIAFELVAGVMLILGVFTRWVAILSAIELFVASTVHFHNGWFFTNPHGGWEYPIFLTVAALALALMGSGTLTLKSLAGK